jgi:hypothetical protein
MAQGDLCKENVGGHVEVVRENLIGIEVDWEGSPGLGVSLINNIFHMVEHCGQAMGKRSLCKRSDGNNGNSRVTM